MSDELLRKHIENFINSRPDLFPGLFTRGPSYRFFTLGNKVFCWTVEPAKSLKGSTMRYGSWWQSKNGGRIRDFREHAKRKDAKARALKLYYASKEATKC